MIATILSSLSEFECVGDLPDRPGFPMDQFGDGDQLFEMRFRQPVDHRNIVGGLISVVVEVVLAGEQLVLTKLNQGLSSLLLAGV